MFLVNNEKNKRVKCFKLKLDYTGLPHFAESVLKQETDVRLFKAPAGKS